MTTLTPHQKKALGAFDHHNADIDIVTLYTRIYGDPGCMTVREMQQKLAPTFKKINLLHTTALIEPGDRKRSYRLTTPARK